jgi:hypothetical protein
METENKPTKLSLQFEMHMINTALLNLHFSIMYNDINEENPQHYLKRLIERLNDVDFNNYINQ